jgi:transcriptional regulator with XRE-family HTH domain
VEASEDIKAFGMKIKILRDSRGWTEEDVAGMIGVSRPYIGRIETGAYFKFNKEVLGKIARLYNLDENETYRIFGYTTTSLNLTARQSPAGLLADITTSLLSYIPLYEMVSSDLANEPVDYIANTWKSPGGNKLKAYRVKGFNYKTTILENDIIITDSQIEIATGALILCKYTDGTISIKKTNTHTETSPEYQSFGVIVALFRRLV